MGTLPLGQECTIARNKINALPVRNRVPVALSSILESMQAFGLPHKDDVEALIVATVRAQTSRKIFDNREDRHAGQPETAGDQ